MLCLVLIIREVAASKGGGGRNLYNLMLKPEDGPENDCQDLLAALMHTRPALGTFVSGPFFFSSELIDSSIMYKKTLATLETSLPPSEGPAWRPFWLVMRMEPR